MYKILTKFDYLPKLLEEGGQILVLCKFWGQTLTMSRMQPLSEN